MGARCSSLCGSLHQFTPITEQRKIRTASEDDGFISSTANHYWDQLRLKQEGMAWLIYQQLTATFPAFSVTPPGSTFLGKVDTPVDTDPRVFYVVFSTAAVLQISTERNNCTPPVEPRTAESGDDENANLHRHSHDDQKMVPSPYAQITVFTLPLLPLTQIDPFFVRTFAELTRQISALANLPLPSEAVSRQNTEQEIG